MHKPEGGAVLAAAAVVAVGAVYAGVTALTTPFTVRADAAVAVGFALMAAVTVSTMRRRRHGHGTGPRPAPRTSGRAFWAANRFWVLCLALFLGLELVTYVAGFPGGRSAFPTVSSLYDSAARWTPVKAALVLAWMALGWGLFSR